MRQAELNLWRNKGTLRRAALVDCRESGFAARSEDLEERVG